MPISCTYLHTNLTEKDIDLMLSFYVGVFGCEPVRSVDHLRGQWIEEITSVERGEIEYVHLRLPGHGKAGPELELIQYLTPTKCYPVTPDTVGFGHVALVRTK